MWTIVGVHGWVKTHERVSGLCEEGKMANKGDDNFVCVFCVFPKKKRIPKTNFARDLQIIPFSTQLCSFCFSPGPPRPESNP